MPSTGQVLSSAIAETVASFHESERLRESSSDPEATHNTRVALRRLRSILRSYGSLFDPGFAGSVRGELGWYARLLGEIRDLDVTAGRLEQSIQQSAELDARSALAAFIETERARAGAALVDARGEPRYQVLLRQLDRLAHDLPLSPRAEQPAASQLVLLLRRPWRDVREAGRVARRSGREIDLHLLRIRAKELRYAAEVASAALGPKSQRVARAARDLQDRVGEHRDARRTISFLEEFERSHGQYPALVGAISSAERRNARRVITRYEDDLANLARAWRKLWRQAEKSSRQILPAQKAQH